MTTAAALSVTTAKAGVHIPVEKAVWQGDGDTDHTAGSGSGRIREYPLTRIAETGGVVSI